MKLLFAVALLCLVGAVAAVEPLSAEEHEFLFTAWTKQHNKVYETQEFFKRFQIWKANLQWIREHNEEGHSYTVAMNQFGDLTQEEYREAQLGYVPIQREFIRSMNYPDLSNVTAGDSVDWRTKNAVTPVKNQQQCGSCWAFSTTGSTEGAWAIAKGQLVSLSEQQLVDCSTAEGNQGCNGGLMDYGFEYIIKNHGLCKESDYPYTATGPNQCKASSCTPAVTISSYKDVPTDDEEALKNAAAIGPVSVAIEADQSAFQFYSGGVFDAACGTQLDHGVLIVGYGTESGKDYWIVKNSWGATWGMSGYILMARNIASSSGQCGIAKQPSYPVV